MRILTRLVKYLSYRKLILTHLLLKLFVMKIGILLILSCLSVTVYGQRTTEHKHTTVFYQDSMEIPQNGFWAHPEENEVVKEKYVRDKKEPNKTRIYKWTRNPRDPQSFNFLNLKDIERVYTGSQKRSTLFIFNGKLIVKDLEEPKIDSSFIRSVEVTKSSDITQVKDQVSEFSILNVRLNWKNNVKAPKHLTTAGIPKLYYAPAEKKEIKMSMPGAKVKPNEAKEFHFLSLKEIEKKYTDSVARSTLFFLDGELLTNNLNSYLIDSSYIYKVEVLPSSGIEYLKDNLPVFTILKISLATLENTRMQGYIRGNETAMRD